MAKSRTKNPGYKEILRAVRRLEKSTTPLVRKRARRELRTMVDRWLAAFPNLWVDEKGETHKVGASGVYLPCPICKGVPVKLFAFPEHFQNKHVQGFSGMDMCLCPSCEKRFASVRGVSRHLAKIYSKSAEEFKAHIIAAATKQALLEAASVVR